VDIDLLTRRQLLVARHDSLAPEGTRPGTASAALCEVAEGLEAVAREAEDRGDRSLEVGRTWRWAGMAYHDAAPGRDEAIVRRAVAAYEQSERFIDRSTDLVDAAKTDYCMGRALMNLADGPDGSVAQHAVDRLVRARSVARGAAPELLPVIEEALVSAEQVAALRAQTRILDSRLQKLRSELAAGSADPKKDEGPSADEVKGLFGLLHQQFDQEQASMSPARRDSLRDVMEELADLVGRAGTERSLGEMAGDRAKLDKLMEQMKPHVRRRGSEE
jgi:hypothetical protein